MTTPQLPAATIWRQPDRRLLLARRLELAAIAVLVAITAGIVVGLTVGPDLAAVTIAAVVIAATAAEWVLRRRWRAWGYAERDDDLLVRHGLLIRRLSVVPYGRMQYVDVTAGPVDRWLGLATVHLHTAAAATEAKVPGLATAEAARLRDSLAALGEARQAGL